jgi:hypothetical protein
MVFVDAVEADACMVVLRVTWVVFMDNDCCVVLLEFTADTLPKFNISVNPNNKSSVNNIFGLI